EVEQYAWTTSWGVSTRLVGALVMTHSDDDGLIVPPRIAPAHVVILPIFRDPEGEAAVMEHVEKLAARLREQRYGDRPIEVEVDTRDLRGGEKNWSWIKRGVPIRIEVGPRDVEAGGAMVVRRDQGIRDKQSLTVDEIVATLPKTLDEIQTALFERAKAYRQEHTREIDDWDEFVAYFTPKNKDQPEAHGGFAMAHWCGEAEVEEQIKEMKVTIRSIPIDGDDEPGRCIKTGKPSPRRVLFAKAY
ncbi:MAG: proline--tRNA ligase, partial [Deltaproteobacteria bacterium]|nr:proline--tRNA ligase [Deltaproteobacteria bacterium]